MGKMGDKGLWECMGVGLWEGGKTGAFDQKQDAGHRITNPSQNCIQRCNQHTEWLVGKSGKCWPLCSPSETGDAWVGGLGTAQFLPAFPLCATLPIRRLQTTRPLC